MHKPIAIAALLVAAFTSGGASAQDYNAMIQQRMARMNAIVGQAEQRVAQVVQNGFSAAGTAHMRANEAGIQQREAAAWQGLRQAEAARGAAQQGQRDAYAANQQEAGRQLLGQSTYLAPNGYRLQLPHTWQPNTTVQHQGQTYHVDAGGRYHVLAANGWWYPLAPAR
jgi:hypothetical protein